MKTTVLQIMIILLMSAIAVLVYHYFVTDKQGTTLTSAKENTVIIRGLMYFSGNLKIYFLFEKV